jgi:uncharacterized protein (TIGR00255 family)
MTGFGKAIAECGDKNIVVEIKSLNSKSLDINTRIAYAYREKDLEIRSVLAEKLVRGKIDVCIYCESKDAGSEKSINEMVVKSYYGQMQKIAADMNIPASPQSIFDAVIRLPEIFSSDLSSKMSDKESVVLKQALEQAIEKIIDYRRVEGAVLAADVRHNVEHIEGLIPQVEQFETQRIERIRERMSQALEEGIAPENIDKNRLEQELIFYIEKLDVSEEKVRLQQHCDYFKQTMNEDNCGKKLGFIAQEIGREINTLGSKSNDAEMQRVVVEMKDYLERIKEQVLNIQ